MSFWIYVTALLLLALVILLLPLLRSGRVQQQDQRQQQNIQIAREQKQQLEAQLADGDIDQAGFDSAYEDLQAALALELGRDESAQQKSRGRWMALVVLLIVPLASVALYLYYGNYRVVENPELARASAMAQTAAAPQMSVEEMETRIKERLRENPEDVEGWFLLGRTYMSQRRFDEAVTAYQRSYDLLPNEAGIIFALADALGMQKNGNLLGEPEELIKRGLQLAPSFPNGLWLAGLAAEQRQDYATAYRYWTELLPLVASNPESSREVGNLLHALEQLDPELAKTATVEAAAGASIQVAVDISAELRAKATPETAVFVYAKAMQGPPMPLAVKKMQLKDLPATLALSDDDAMMPALKLSGFDPVIVGARVSFSGNPVAQSGDFFTEVDSISSANPPGQLELTIDQVRE